MPKMDKKVELTQNELRAWELFNAPHNLKTKDIANKMGKSISSVDRYLKGYRLKAKPEEIDTTAIEREKEFEEKCWKVLDDSLKAKKPYGKDAILFPDNTVRLSAAVKYLNSKGKLIERKEIDTNLNFSGMSPDELTSFINNALKDS